MAAWQTVKLTGSPLSEIMKVCDLQTHSFANDLRRQASSNCIVPRNTDLIWNLSSIKCKMCGRPQDNFSSVDEKEFHITFLRAEEDRSFSHDPRNSEAYLSIHRHSHSVLY